jgi:hypothetical protein
MTKRPSPAGVWQERLRGGPTLERALTDIDESDDDRPLERYAPRWSPRADVRADGLKMSPQLGRYLWGPYFNALFPSRLVTQWIYFKIGSSGMNVARRLWDQREDLRREYEVVHGTDRASWPVRHPGVVLDCVKWIAHPACLGCYWFHKQGPYMREEGWHDRALRQATSHQESGGTEHDEVTER